MTARGIYRILLMVAFAGSALVILALPRDPGMWTAAFVFGACFAATMYELAAERDGRRR